MTFTINFVNTEHNVAIEQIIKSMVLKTFTDNDSIDSVIVNLHAQNHIQVPWKCNVYLTETNQKLITAESQAANYLTAFSQALMRLKRQWDKQQNSLRA